MNEFQSSLLIELILTQMEKRGLEEWNLNVRTFNRISDELYKNNYRLGYGYIDFIDDCEDWDYIGIRYNDRDFLLRFKPTDKAMERIKWYNRIHSAIPKSLHEAIAECFNLYM